MNVEQIMNREVRSCGPHDSLNKAAQIMWYTPCGAVPVVDQQGRPIGFLTDRDVCMAAYTLPLRVAGRSRDGANAGLCLAEDDLDSAAQPMRQHRTRRVPVIDGNGVLVGLLTLDDLACEAARPLRGGKNANLGELVLEVLLSINRGRIRLQPAV